MTAIVAGQGLGLTNTSLGLLGDQGQLGVASQGRSGEKVLVNASNGNLVVQQQDEWLVGMGPDVSVLRTYNSQATSDDDNGDNWRLGLSRKVHGLSVSPAVNTVGSTIKRVAEDGSEAVYSYNAVRGLYINQDGAGSLDTLQWNGSSTWTWTDGDTRVSETYQAVTGVAAGEYRLKTVQDLDGKQLTLSYDNTSPLVTKVLDASGESVVITYAGKNIQSISTLAVGGAQTLKRVTYGYDTNTPNNRLTKVTVDLSPQDGNITDAKTYVTDYTYEGTSNRLASMVQTGGSKLEFTYLAGKVETIKEYASSTDIRTTRFDYSVVGTTTITDPLSQVTTLTYDTSLYSETNPKAGQLRSITTPAVNSLTQTTSYAYDASGNVSQVTDARGKVTTYRYDANGNRIYERNAEGGVIERSFGSANQLLTQTVYTAADSDGFNTGVLATDGLTTRYLYDTKNHLRFVISPEGRVTEHQYNTAGQRKATLQYNDGYTTTAVSTWDQRFNADTSGLNPTTLPAGIAHTNGTLVFTSTQTSAADTYPTVKTGAAAMLGSRYRAEITLPATVTANLLHIGVESGAQGTANYRRNFLKISSGQLYLNSYQGTILAQTTLGPALAGKTYVLEIETQLDGGSQLYVYEIGKERSSGYAGRVGLGNGSNLIQFTMSGFSGASATNNSIWVDNVSRQLPPGVSELSAWADARPAKASRTDYTYDFRGQLSTQRTYAKVDATTGAGVLSEGTHSIIEYVYDQSGNLVEKIDNLNQSTLSSYAYDGLNRITSQTDGLGKTTTTLYSDSERKTKITLANDLVTITTHDRAGRVISVERTSDDATPLTLGTTLYTYDTLGRLVATATPTGEKTFYLYDEAGRKVGEIDAENALTEYTYNGNHQVVRTKRYATKVDAAKLTGNGIGLLLSGTAGVRPADSTLDDRTTRNIHDKAGRLVMTIDAVGAVVEYRYDGAGRLSDTWAYAKMLTSTQLITLANATIELGANNATIVFGSNSADSIELTPHGSDRRIRNFYSGDGLLVGQLDAEGYYTEHTYDKAARLIKTKRYANGAGVVPEGNVPPTVATDAANDQNTHYLYNARSQVVGMVDAQNYYTLYEYDRFGNKTLETRYANAVVRTFDGTTAPIVVAINGAAPELGSYVLANAEDQSSLHAYDANNRLSRTTSQPTGLVTTFDYDQVGNLVKTTQALGLARDERVEQRRYDKLGRLIGELSGVGSKAIKDWLAHPDNAGATADAKAAKIEDLWKAYGIAHEYDQAGRRVLTIERNGQTGSGLKTYFYYDKAGRLTQSINALGEVVQYGYNTFGEQNALTRVATKVSNLDVLKGGLNSTLGAAVLLDASKDDKTSTGRDQRGLATRTLDALGNLTQRWYSAFGEFTATRQQIGATTTAQTDYIFDRRGLLKSSTQKELGYLLAGQTYDAFGRVLTRKDGLGRVTSFTYDRLGRQVSSTDRNSALTSTTYDAFSRVLTMTDGLGVVTSHAYNSTTNTFTVTTAGVLQGTTELNLHGQVIGQTNARSHKTTHTYNADGQLTQTSVAQGGSLPNLVTQNWYDKAGRIYDTVDANGMVTRHSYDSASRLVTREADFNGLKLKTGYKYDALGRSIWIEDANGVWTQTEYHLNGQVKAVVVDPKKGPSWASGEPDNNPDGLALRTEYTYDKRGKTLTVIEGAGSTTTQPKTTKYVYDAAGRRTSEVIDPDGLAITTSYTYDNNDNVVAKTNALDHTTRYVYDAENQLTYVVDALGGVVKTEYDHEGQVSRTTAYANRLSLSTLGQAITEADITSRLAAANAAYASNSANQVNAYVYDKWGRLSISVDALGYATQHVRDAVGNVTAVTRYAIKAGTLSAAKQTGALISFNAPTLSADPDKKDRVEQTVYDGANRPIWSVNAEGYATARAFDGNGNVIRTTRYANPLQFVTPGQTLLTKNWAPIVGTSTVAGNSTIASDSAKDQTSHYVYDKAGRLIWSVDAERYVTQNTYDKLGQLRTTTRHAKPLDAAYVAGAAPAVVIQDDDVKTEYVYDEARRQTEQIDALLVKTKTVYDDVGRAIDVTQAHGASEASTTKYVYDDAGRLTDEVRAYGTAEQANTRYVLDKLGQRIKVIDPRGVELAKGSSDWAKAERTRLIGTPNAPDHTSQQYQTLLDQYATTQEFDANGRITKTSGALSQVEISTEFDVFGNAVKVTDPNNNVGYFYFDKLNQATWSVDPMGFATQTEFDAFGQVSKITKYVAPASGTLSTSAKFGAYATATAATTAGATAYVLTSSTEQDQLTQIEHDKQGRQTKITDAAGFFESMTYDGLGNKDT
ncbi:MAG: hypothetical protein Q7V63_09275, partial [Gammaproteobacteria bacterium]|nr:hypothetical protein [Gammaproteobacteria bacterium]